MVREGKGQWIERRRTSLRSTVNANKRVKLAGGKMTMLIEGSDKLPGASNQ